MKAREILDWIIKYSLNGEDLNSVEISAGNEFESQPDFILRFFGCSPDKVIQPGEYLYVYSDVLPEDFYVSEFLKDADLVLDCEDCKIYLIRIED